MFASFSGSKTMTMTRPALLLALLFGCSVSDPSVLDPLRDDVEDDGGMSEDDAQVDIDMNLDLRQGADSCGDSSAFVIGQRQLDIIVDTRGLSNQTTVPCAPSAGNDAFFALDVVAGEVWHFHLTSAGAEARNPVLYLLSDDCDDRACIQNSDSCAGTGDEHFAFVAPSTGRWYLGIDSAEAGGGVFQLDAFRPVCGDGMQEHGETCDSDEPSACGGAGCVNCRCRVSPSSPGEKFPNDNLYEANQIDLEGTDSITITGGLAGPGSCDESTYPDVYTILINDQEDLSVSLNNFSGTDCASGDDVPVQLSLLTSSGSLARPQQSDGNGCAIIDAADLPSGRYFIHVADGRPVDRSALAYQLDLAVAP